MKFNEFLRSKKYTEEEIKLIQEDLLNEKNSCSKNVQLAIEYSLSFSSFAFPKKDTREGRKMEAARMYKQMTMSCPKMKKSEKIKTIANKFSVKEDCIRVYLRESDMK